MPACRQCGESNPSEARLCWSCGEPLAHAGLRGEERRVVTVLFVDIVEFTRIAERLDPEDLKGVQAPYFDRVRTEIERYGGHVEKYIGDAVMALFGAPVAYGDDAQRGVLAAFAIRRAIAELNDTDGLDLQVRIGVNTGEAFVDLAAQTSAGEGMAAGDVVVTCFRLQQAAPVGEIVVGEATVRASQRAIEYAEIEPVAAKGKQEPVRAWTAVSVREPGGRSATPLVGRATELEHLRSLVCPDEPDGVRVVTVTGAPGIGKSRLLWELRESLAGADEPVVWRQGRCLPYGAGISFSAFAEVVKAHLEILESDPADTVAQRLSAAVAALVEDETARAWVEAYLRPLVGLGGAERLSGDRRAEAFSAWRRFVVGLAAGGRVVLALEDVHWADDGLLDFVEHLREWATGVPLTVLCTARPELVDRRPAWPGIVPLEPLSTEDTGELAELLLGDRELRPGLRDELLARAGGNPLYTEEFVRMLEERTDDDRLELPETVQAIIAGRLDTLHPEAKEVLRDAAVVGTGFWVGALEHVGGLPREQIERRLGELQWRELVRPQPRSAVAEESQYAFWHVLVRDVAYAQIPRAARVRKHLATAGWIESLAPDRADLTELLAHHYASALEYARMAHQEVGPLAQRTRLVLRDAGVRALSLYAYPAAAGHFRRALDLWPDDPQRPELLFELGRALHWSERGGRKELAEARGQLVAAGDPERAARADVLLCRIALAGGDADEAERRAVGAVELLEGRPPSRARAEAVSNLAGFHALRGEPERALPASGEALALAEALGLDEIRTESLTFRGHARIRGGDAGGIEDLEQAVEVAEQAGAPGIVRSCANLATSLVELGQLERAWAVYEQGRSAATRFGDAHGLHWLAAERPYELYWRGLWEEALAAAEASLREPDAGYVEHAARSVRAWIRLARGDTAGAVEDSTWAVEFARQATDPAALCQGLALGARVLAEAGRADQAAAVAGEAAAEAAEAGVVLSFWTADLADGLRELGRSEGLPSPAAGGIPTRWLLAARQVVAGAFAEAAAEYAAIGARPEEAKARLRAAAALAEDGERAAAERQAEQALAFYREVGATAYARRAESLLAAAPVPGS